MLSCYKDGALEYQGIIEFTDANNLVYHILHSMKQVYGKPDHHPIYLSGTILAGDEAVMLLKKYIRNLHFFKNPLPFDIAGGVCENFFGPLTGTHHCE